MITNGSSGLQFFSFGIVVEDKARDSDELIVFPIEELPFADGPLSKSPPPHKHALPNAQGVASSASAQSGVTLRATWLPFGTSNRITSPDCVKNETVLLLKYADADLYYWITPFREPEIRRQETVCYMFGNLKTPLVEWDKSTSYWFEVSTHDKRVQLHTARSDGEPYAYDFTINTAEGTVELKDDVGNNVTLNSKEGTLTVTMTKCVQFNAPDVNFNNRTTTDGAASMKSTLGVKDTVTMDNQLSVKNAVSMDNNLSVKSAVTANGNVSVMGTMAMLGEVEMPGMKTLGGNISISKALAVGTELTAKTITAERVIETNPI